MTKAALFIDFDGTISPVDISNTFFTTRAGSDARLVVDQWKRGLVSSRECLIRELDAFGGDLGELREFARSLPIDQGFFQLQKECRRRGVGVFVVSDGLDFYIEPFLAKHDAKVKTYSNRLVIKDGICSLAFPYYNQACGHCANCKSSHVEREKRKGKAIIYVGDGLSDKCAASKADLIFAKGDLEEYCKIQGIPYHRFDRLSEVADQIRLRRIGESG